MLISVVALLGLSFALAWTMFFGAGVWPPDWEIALLVIGASSILFGFFHRGKEQRRTDLPPVLNWLIIGFPVYIAVTLIPLPSWVLQVLSPTRAALLWHLQPVIPGLHHAPLSVNPPATTLSLFSILGYTAAFLVIRELSLFFSFRPWLTIAPLFVLAVLEGSLGLLQALGGSASGAVTGTYTNRDHFAGLLEMVFPFALLQGFAILQKNSRRGSRARPVLFACSLFAAGALLFLAIAYSLSRMGFIVVLFELLLVWLFGAGWRPSTSRRRWPLLAGAAVAILLVCAFLSPEKMSARFSIHSSHANASNEIRASLWKETIPLIFEYPLFGCGMGGFESVFLKHQSVANAYAVEFAHNDYLQYSAELGIAGFSLIAAILGILFWQMIRGTASANNSDRRLLLLACTTAFSGMLVHSFVDFNMYIPANALILAWIAGVGSANAAPE